MSDYDELVSNLQAVYKATGLPAVLAGVDALLACDRERQKAGRREATLREALERIEGGTATYSYRELREIACRALSSADTQAAQKESE